MGNKTIELWEMDIYDLCDECQEIVRINNRRNCNYEEGDGYV